MVTEFLASNFLSIIAVFWKPLIERQGTRYYGLLQATKNQERLKMIVAKAVGSFFLPARDKEAGENPKNLYITEIWWQYGGGKMHFSVAIPAEQWSC